MLKAAQTEAALLRSNAHEEAERSATARPTPSARTRSAAQAEAERITGDAKDAAGRGR